MELIYPEVFLNASKNFFLLDGPKSWFAFEFDAPQHTLIERKTVEDIVLLLTACSKISINKYCITVEAMAKSSINTFIRIQR